MGDIGKDKEHIELVPVPVPAEAPVTEPAAPEVPVEQPAAEPVPA